MQAKLILLTLLAMVAGAMMVSPHDAPTPVADGTISVANLGPVEEATLDVDVAERGLLPMGVGLRSTDRERYRSEISDREAIRIALAKGEAFVAARGGGNPLLRDLVRRPGTPEPAVARAETETPGVILSVRDLSADNAEPAPTPAWRVTGDSVNLRAGPSTGSEIVGVASLGEELTPLSDTSASWVEVRRGSGESAWIFARFLEPGGT